MTKRYFIHKYLSGNRWRLFGVIVFAVFAVFMSLLSPLVLSFFIDQVIDEKPITNAIIQLLVDKIGGISYLQTHLYIGGVVILLIYLISGICFFLRGYLSGKMSEDMSYRIRNDLFEHIQKLPYDYHIQTKTGDLVQRCTSDVEVIRRVFGQQIQQMVRAIMIVGLAITILFQINARLSLRAIILMPFLFLYAYYFFQKSQKVFLASDESEGEMTSVIQENISGIRVIKAFGKEKYEVDRFADYNKDFKDKTFLMIQLLGRYWSSSDLICTLQILIVLFSGIQAVQNGMITIGNFTVFLTYEGMILWPIRMLGRILSDFGKSSVSIGRLIEILDVPQEELNEGITPEIKGEIEFRHLTFTYQKDVEPVLKDISLKVEPGQTIAILGPTGSGKSSLVHLLTGLYPYQEGSILLDGHALKDIQKKYLRSQVGIVFQEPFLYSKTIYENIQLGHSDARKEDIEQAAEIASVHGVIEEFDQGYDTLVGEKGVTLSGGQKQRIAIARTLMNQSKILIFDDSLSAVDTETDQQIRKALQQRKQGITTIIITQRINSAKDADAIFVMEDGRITQSGTHEQLVQEEGLYKRIYEIQSYQHGEQV